MTDLTREQIAELLGGIEDPLHWHNSGRAKQEMNNAAPDLARQLLATPTAIAASPEMQALLAAETARADAAEAMIYRRTGVKDRDGREICVGDRIRIDLSSPHTKEEYWRPEYEVIFRAPHYNLKHVGGDKDSDTARWYFSTPQPSSTARIETTALAQQPPASGDDGRG